MCSRLSPLHGWRFVSGRTCRDSGGRRAGSGGHLGLGQRPGRQAILMRRVLLNLQLKLNACRCVLRRALVPLVPARVLPKLPQAGGRLTSIHTAAVSQ